MLIMAQHENRVAGAISYSLKRWLKKLSEQNGLGRYITRLCQPRPELGFHDQRPGIFTSVDD